MEDLLRIRLPRGREKYNGIGGEAGGQVCCGWGYRGEQGSLGENDQGANSGEHEKMKGLGLKLGVCRRQEAREGCSVSRVKIREL